MGTVRSSLTDGRNLDHLCGSLQTFGTEMMKSYTIITLVSILNKYVTNYFDWKAKFLNSKQISELVKFGYG